MSVCRVRCSGCVSVCRVHISEWTEDVKSIYFNMVADDLCMNDILYEWQVAASIECCLYEVLVYSLCIIYG